MSTPTDGQPSSHSLRMFQDVSTPPVSDGANALAAPQTAPARVPLTVLPNTQTSSLERYLAQIADPTLRENLAREIAGMGRTFGLVFERHHPEGIRLPKHKVKRNSKVVINTEKNSGYYRIARLAKNDGTALLVDDDGNQSIYPIGQLTVAKEFGDIMYPGLRKLSEIRNDAPDAPVHTIINGENYHALEALQYTHSGKVDLIYIDPPYNTGNADWKYNDRYIDSKDGYRHSKWLSFMEKRLLIARKLLSPDGVILVSIDDNEQSRLRILMDQVFGEPNFLNTIVWYYGKMSNESRKFANNHEYILAYGAGPGSKLVPSVKKEDSEYRNRWPAFINADNQILYGAVKHKRDALIDLRVRKIAKTGVEITDDTVLFDFNKEYKVDSDTIYVPTIKGNAAEKVKTFDALGQKPLELMRRLLSAFPRKDAVILDFFGGSGTTAEAVIRLNAEDGGTRQAILVTNNELSKKDDARLRKDGHAPGDDEYEALGVFHHVTKPRLETVITGVRPDGSTYSEGLAANAAFFELTYLEEPEIVAGKALGDLAGLFWLKSGGTGGTVDIDAAAKRDGYAISESGAAAILFTPGRARALADHLKAADQNIAHLFIVTDSEAAGEEAASHFPLGINVERIYGNYLEAFQVNRKD